MEKDLNGLLKKWEKRQSELRHEPAIALGIAECATELKTLMKNDGVKNTLDVLQKRYKEYKWLLNKMETMAPYQNYSLGDLIDDYAEFLGAEVVKRSQ